MIINGKEINIEDINIKEDFLKKRSNGLLLKDSWIEVLNKYMPTQLTEEEIDKIINEAFDTVKPTSIKDLGTIMKFVNPSLKGKADMSMVNIRIKERLNNL